MKKLFFIAASAGAALVSCTKNEVAQSVNEQQEITFASPIVGTTTKASTNPQYGLLTGNYPTGVSFGVWGWYNDAEDTNFPYMTDVEVKWNANDHSSTDPQTGAWDPIKPYYWPKNGTLTFDAYSPFDIQGANGCTVSCDPVTGLSIAGYVVPNTGLTSAETNKQIDVLYSTRTAPQNSSVGTTGDTYEGVDIVFNHALAAVAFTVKAADTYPTGTIKVESIIVNAYSTGDFTQNLNSNPAKTPAWVANTSMDYTVLSKGSYEAAQEVSKTEAAAGVTTLMMPQLFSDSKATITVNYYIKNNDETPLPQTAIFNLNVSENQSGKVQKEKEEEEEDEAVTVDKWEMGKIYTYNLTIGLQGIYFAPTIDNWDNVSVDLPQINN